MQIEASKTPLIEDFLSDKKKLFSISKKYCGPVNIVFPQQIKENIKLFSDTLKSTGVNFKIYLAHKPTKSKSLIKEANNQNIGIDVASLNELQSALSAGFTGDQIGCTGPKTRNFLEMAARHGCLISVDSIMELKMLARIRNGKIRILLRIADLECKDRNYIGIESRFGIPKKMLDEVYEILDDHIELSLEGFHYHNNVRVPEVKAGFLDDVISIMQDAYKKGFSPTIINIGGDFRRPTLHDYSEWGKFLDVIEQALIQNKSMPTWRNYSYSMYLNSKNRVSGRGKIQGMFTATKSEEVISTMLLNTSLRGRALSEIIAENMWSLMVEPGWILFQQCGITLVEVIGTKQTASGKNLVIVNANRTNFSTNMKEWFTDPIHLSKDNNNNNNNNNNVFEGFIVGNLCEENDFLIKRLIHFRWNYQTRKCFLHS